MKSCSRYVLLLPFFLLLGSAYGQTVYVLNEVTLKPISGVAVFSSDLAVFTESNAEGLVDLSIFSDSDTLIFQHPSFQNRIISYALVLENEFLYLNESTIQIDEVVIRGVKWEQSGEIPQTVVTISPSDIQFNNPQTSADLLTINGQVFVQKSQLGGGSPMIRGFAANALLIAVNGIRMNNAIFRSGNLQNVISLDPNMIERTDVILGPGSVIYGSDALGGVMNFRVKEPQFNDASFGFLKATSFLRYSSADSERTGHLNFNLGSQRFSWLSSFTYSQFDDLTTGARRTAKFPDYGKRFDYVIPNGINDSLVSNPNVNEQVYSGYSAWQTIQRLKLGLSDATFLNYDFFYSTTSDVPRYDRLAEEEGNGLVYSEWNYGPQEWMMNTLTLSTYSDEAFYEELRVILAYQKVQESRIDRKFQARNRRSRTESVHVWTLNVDLEKEFGEKHQIAYGLEAVTNHVASEAHTEDVTNGQRGQASTRYPDGGSDVSSAGLYATYQHQWRENALLTMGARYQHFYLLSRFSDTTFYQFPYDEIELRKGALTGNLGLTVSTPTLWQFDFLLSSGFRAPNVDDVGKVFDSEPGSVVVPNQDLGPEYIYNAEITVSKAIRDKFEISINGFYSLLRDAMVRREFTFNGKDSILYDGEWSQVEALVNVGTAFITGVSGTLTYSPTPKFSFYSSVTYMDGEDTSEHIPLRHTTPLFGITSVTWRGQGFRTELNARYQGPRTWNDLAPSEQNKPQLYTTDGALGWMTLNGYLSYNPIKQLQCNVGVENILNAHYRPYSNGISAPGRNFILSLRYSI